MSHQVTVNYEGMSIQIQAQCDTAVHSLCKIDKTLENIHKTASKLESSKVKEYEKYLMDSKELIKDKIEKFKGTLEKYKALKQVTGGDSVMAEYEQVRVQLQRQASELSSVVNELTGSKLEVINQMINDGLLDLGTATSQNLLNKINGVVSVPQEIINKINSIEDISLRELAYREVLNDNNLNYESALANAKIKYDELLGKRTTKVIEEYKEELKNNGVSSEALDNVRTIEEATAITNEAITDEKIRKETLKVIIKAIKERGFIVDTKKNLKIDKEKNIVKLVALKASGQTAEFEIQLNGKFMYHFEGYEGLACNKDITPFIEDLRNVYDINILHEEVQWSNPDKIQTQKYQYVNKNKGTN